MRPGRPRTLLAVAVAALACPLPATAHAQGFDGLTVGSPRALSAAGPQGEQRGFSGQHGSVAARPGGDFLAVWMSSAGRTSAILAQRIGRDGTPQGEPVRLDAGDLRGGDYLHTEVPVVAYNRAQGAWFAVWRESRRSGEILVGRAIADSGEPAGPPIELSTGDRGGGTPSIACATTGCLVAWSSFADARVTTRTIGPAGVPTGDGPVAVSARTNPGGFGGDHVAVAVTDAGYVLAWGRVVARRAVEVRMRRLGFDGAPLDAERTVSRRPRLRKGTYSASTPSMCASADGSTFVMAWTGSAQVWTRASRRLDGIFTQAYRSDGSRLGPDRRLEVTLQAENRGVPAARRTNTPALDFVTAAGRCLLLYLRGFDLRVAAYGPDGRMGAARTLFRRVADFPAPSLALDGDAGVVTYDVLGPGDDSRVFLAPLTLR